MNLHECNWVEVPTNSSGITSARARWDDETEHANPGWVIDVSMPGGHSMTLPSSPVTYYLSHTPAAAKAALKDGLWFHFEIRL